MFMVFFAFWHSFWVEFRAALSAFPSQSSVFWQEPKALLLKRSSEIFHVLWVKMKKKFDHQVLTEKDKHKLAVNFFIIFFYYSNLPYLIFKLLDTTWLPGPSWTLTRNCVARFYWQVAFKQLLLLGSPHIYLGKKCKKDRFSKSHGTLSCNRKKNF